MIGYESPAGTGGGGGITAVNVSAGTTSNNMSAITFGNAGGVSFGLAGSVVTAVGGPSPVNFSAGTTSNNLGTVVFSNSNRVSFGLNGSTITAQHAINFSGGTTSNNVSDQLIFSNSNNVSFGLNGSTLTATATVASTQASINLSAGTTSNLASAFTFSNLNGVSFGLNASTITASHNAITSQSNQQMTMFATGNTTQSSTGTTNASSLIFNGAGNVSVGITGGSVVISGGTAAAAPVNFSAGTTSNNLGSVVFSDSNGVSWGLNGSTITASVATSLTNIRISAGTTSNLLSAITFSNATGIDAIQFGLNASTITASASRATYSSTMCGMWLGVLSSSTVNQNSLFLYPHILEDYLTCAVVKMPLAITNSSSATASCQNGWTANFAIYTRNSTNSTVLTRHYSTTYTMAVSHNSNASWMLSLITAVGNSTSYSTLSASSLGINLSSSLHGVREIILPMSSLFTPGEYWMGYLHSTSSAGAAGSVLRISNVIYVSNSGNRVGLATNVSSPGLGQNIGQGVYSASTASPPAGISFTEINAAAIAIPVFFLSATQ